MTNSNYKRLPKFWMIFRLWKVSKSAFFLFISIKVITNFLPISYSFLVTIYSVYFFIEYTTIYWQWLNFKYKLDSNRILIKKGIIFKTEQSVSNDQIQNINMQSPFFHKIFNYSMITIIIGSTGDNSTIKIPILSINEALNIAKKLDPNVSNNKNINDYHMIHKTNIKEIVVGSITFTKVLFFSSFLYSLQDKLVDYFNFSLTDFLRTGLESTSSRYIIIIAFIIIYILYNIIKNYLIYGNYIIKENENYIVLSKGIIDKNSIFIRKKHVQGIIINYTLIQKLFNLCTIKLVLVSNEEDSQNKVNIFLPFIKFDKGVKIIKRIFPEFSYEYTHTIPKKSFVLNFIRNKYFYFILTILFLNNTFGLNFLFLVIIIAILIQNVLSPFYNGYKIAMNKIIIKSLKLSMNIYITNLTRVEEITTSQKLLQRKMGVYSFSIINKEKPYIKKKINDIPIENHNELMKFYKDTL